MTDLTDWIRIQSSSGSNNELGPLQLAWLGDAVWELHQRLRNSKKPARGKDLHDAVVLEVSAIGQSHALKYLDRYLSDFEKDLVRKGRNKAGQGPRRVDPRVYGQATGFETIVGWLFLHNPERLAQLLDRLEDSDSQLHKHFSQ